jgi:hypothetical protein
MLEVRRNCVRLLILKRVVKIGNEREKTKELAWWEKKNCFAFAEWLVYLAAGLQVRLNSSARNRLFQLLEGSRWKWTGEKKLAAY